MQPDSDTIRTARRLVELYRADAESRAQLRADTTGDHESAQRWRRIVEVIRILKNGAASDGA
jgi:hypothetical protein